MSSLFLSLLLSPKLTQVPREVHLLPGIREVLNNAPEPWLEIPHPYNLWPLVWSAATHWSWSNLTGLLKVVLTSIIKDNEFRHCLQMRALAFFSFLSQTSPLVNRFSLHSPASSLGAQKLSELLSLKLHHTFSRAHLPRNLPRPWLPDHAHTMLASGALIFQNREWSTSLFHFQTLNTILSVVCIALPLPILVEAQRMRC